MFDILLIAACAVVVSGFAWVAVVVLVITYFDGVTG